MLNELIALERGVQQAGIEMGERHPTVKDVGKMPKALVSLDVEGQVVRVRPLPLDVSAWTVRDGQHHSFPAVQLSAPLWSLGDDNELRKNLLHRSGTDRRNELLGFEEKASFNSTGLKKWPGGLLDRLCERRSKLASLEDTDAQSFLDVIDRFVRACDGAAGGDPSTLLKAVLMRLIEGVRQSAQDDWIAVAIALLVGKLNRKKEKWECAGALLFDCVDPKITITDPRMMDLVSSALRSSEGQRDQATVGRCGLTGVEGPLYAGNFPQPTLPSLGQTWLFSKNREIPANNRYDRFASDAMSMGSEVPLRLAAALSAVTTSDRKRTTWLPIPGEGRKQTDLLVVFVDAVLEAECAALLGEDDGVMDYSQEAEDPVSSGGNSVAAFEKRTERIVGAVRAKVSADFRRTPVRLMILRKVDRANRKVVYAGAPTVGDVYDAATAWARGERNLPPWLALPIMFKGERKPRIMGPPHVAPLALVPFTKQLFVRGGTDRLEVTGIAAGEALGLFLDSSTIGGMVAQRRARRILQTVFRQRAALMAGTAHALRRGTVTAKDFDRREGIRTVTVLGVLLQKLGRNKEVYMADAAFKLGQLLAAADVVHAGYCADVRDGKTPPSLLGNQVLTMAQSTPAKALAALGRRWKPYDGWAKKAGRDPKRSKELNMSEKSPEKQREMDIRRALRHAREMSPLAKSLEDSLKQVKVDDVFRAELLLGYMAGLPKRPDGGEAEKAGDAGTTTAEG